MEEKPEICKNDPFAYSAEKCSKCEHDTECYAEFLKFLNYITE